MRKKSVLLMSMSLALLVGLVGTAVVWAQSGALVQASGQRVEPPVGTLQPDLPSSSDAVTAQEVNPDELSLVSRPLPQAQGTPGVPVAGPACLVAAISQETPLATQSPPLTCFESLEQAKAAVPADLTILGILYEHAPPGGRSLVIYGDNCNNQGVPGLAGL